MSAPERTFGADGSLDATGGVDDRGGSVPIVDGATDDVEVTGAVTGGPVVTRETISVLGAAELQPATRASTLHPAQMRLCRCVSAFAVTATMR